MTNFVIESDGQLKTKVPLNHEGQSSYTVTVTATDTQGRPDATPSAGPVLDNTIVVTIEVTDANDAPMFADEDATDIPQHSECQPHGRRE